MMIHLTIDGPARGSGGWDHNPLGGEEGLHPYPDSRYHEDLSIKAVCRICEVEGQKQLPAACSTLAGVGSQKRIPMTVRGINGFMPSVDLPCEIDLSASSATQNKIQATVTAKVPEPVLPKTPKIKERRPAVKS